MHAQHIPQTLKHIPELLHTFLEITSDVIWSFDFQKNEYNWLASPENQKKYGISDTDSGNFWSKNLHWADAVRAQTEYRLAANNPTITEFSHTYFFSGSDNSLILIHDKMKFIRDKEGNPQRVVGVWRDITTDIEHNEYVEDSIRIRHALNQELALREEKIRLTQEELKQTNEQLTMNYQQLAERESILNLSQRLAKIGSWEYEYSSGNFFWSEEMYNVYGVDKSTNPNDIEYLITLFEPASRQVIEGLLEGVMLKTTLNFDVAVQIITPIGYRKWLRIAGFCPENKPLDRIIGIVYDITYFKEAEIRLRSSEEKFSKAFNGNPDPMFIVRQSDNVIIDANNKTGPLLGYSIKDLIGRELLSTGIFSSENDAVAILSPELPDNSELECTLLTHQGRSLFALISRNTIYIEGVANYIFVIKDITARKVAEERLRLSEANLKATMNNTNVMVWSVDRDLRYVMMNTAFLQYIKQTYNYDLQVGMYIMPETKNPMLIALSSKWIQFYKRALSGETFSLSEERFGRHLSYSLNPIIENGKVIGVSIFAEDITEGLQNRRELADAHRAVAEYKLIALRSVMNPHFIFNALNSIQYFITKNDRLNAFNYLSTFSKLIRGILTSSKNSTVKLADEIEVLKHYIQLEMLRFENKFQFILNVDPEIDIENIEVQSLIVQPFVENAILHGLYNSERNGVLQLSIMNDTSGRIIFVIEDNGIGRKAARELRNKVNPLHQSVGITLTEERLRLINNNKDVDIFIEDLYEENQPAGTKVKIWVNV